MINVRNNYSALDARTHFAKVKLLFQKKYEDYCILSNIGSNLVHIKYYNPCKKCFISNSQTRLMQCN